MMIATANILFGYPDKESSADFIVYRNNKSIGTLKVVSKRCSQGYRIGLISDINTRIVFDFHIKITVENVMGNEYMIGSYAERKINGRTTIMQVVSRENGTYILKDKEMFSRKIPDKINFTTTVLYFKEPIGVAEVYSEQNSLMAPLRQIAKSTYQLDLPGGDRSMFFYESGVLIKVISKSKYGEVVFKRS